MSITTISPHHVTNIALKGVADDVAERLGKHRSGIYAMGEDPEKDRYSRFVQFWLVLADLAFPQADLLFRDFEARRNAVCPTRKGRQTNEQKALGDVSERAAAVVRGYLDEVAEHEKLRLIAEAQEALRGLTDTILSKGERSLEQRP
jgi:hypothetical protein